MNEEGREMRRTKGGKMQMKKEEEAKECRKRRIRQDWKKEKKRCKGRAHTKD